MSYVIKYLLVCLILYLWISTNGVFAYFSARKIAGISGKEGIILKLPQFIRKPHNERLSLFIVHTRYYKNRDTKY